MGHLTGGQRGARGLAEGWQLGLAVVPRWRLSPPRQGWFWQPESPVPPAVPCVWLLGAAPQSWSQCRAGICMGRALSTHPCSSALPLGAEHMLQTTVRPQAALDVFASLSLLREGEMS